MAKLLELDFTEHDTIAAFEYFLDMAKRDMIGGSLIAISFRNRRKSDHAFAATGRLGSNLTEAAGLAGLLHLQMVQSALENS